MRQQLASRPARTRSETANPLPASRAFAPVLAAAPLTASPRASHDFGAVAVGPARPAPAEAPIQRQLRRRGPNGFVDVPPEQQQRRPARSFVERQIENKEAEYANLQQRPTERLRAGVSATAGAAGTLLGDNVVGAALNLPNTVYSTYKDGRRAIAEFGNGEYRNAGLTAANAATRVVGTVAGALGIQGAGLATTATTTALEAAKKRQKTE